MMPTISTKMGGATVADADGLILPVYTDEPIASGLDARFDRRLAPTLAAAGFTGKRGEVAAYPTFGVLPARWLILTGLGERATVDNEMLRRAYGAAITQARDAGARTVAVALPVGVDAEGVSAIVEGIVLALYHFATYKSHKGDPSKEVVSVELWSADMIPPGAVEHGQIVAAAVALARDMVNTISNDKTPPLIAAWAQRVSRESGLPCEVLDEKALASGGYNSILAVGKGSAAPPRLVEMVYEPSGGATKTVALVGKTITFDSGGLDVKAQDNMYPMKNDLGGGAAVLGAMQAIAAIKPNVRVIGIMAAAENMPSGTAMRPSDVVTALNGKTFEIGNTDAEGRMVLADAVTHAARAGADEIISVATLTGGVFGPRGAAALGNDQALIDRFLAVAAAAGERLWQLPIWEEYRDDLHSDIADIKSTGPRDAGAGTILAALFIGEFVEEIPWLHLDIAMAADTDRAGPYTPIGATGVMVRSLIRYLEAVQ
ncbi:MAG: leucyl aminopeptidase [Thermomicrobiales bacterium]